MGKIVQIEGVVLTPLRIIHIEEGNVLHGMKKGDLGYKHFGEAYFSTLKWNAIKAWKKHLRMTLNIIVPVGAIRFVLFDDRQSSMSKGAIMEVELSQQNYQRLTIPPGLWTGFQGIGKGLNLLLNIADIQHDPSESEKLDIVSAQINYKWSRLA